MLTELCAYLKNYDFNHRAEKLFGEFIISGGSVNVDGIRDGQYYRIVGSLYNDGIHLYPTFSLRDEVFNGAVWLMWIPDEVVKLAEDIEAWNAKYAGVDGVLNSPYQSESYANYSYTIRGSMGNGEQGNKPIDWKTQFAARLSPWRKIRAI